MFSLYILLSGLVLLEQGTATPHRRRGGPSDAVILPATLSSRHDEPGHSSQSPYARILSANGADFFSHFATFTGPDPTKGSINYTDMAFAQQHGYVNTSFNQFLGRQTAYVGMDHENKAPQGRNSVRLSSNTVFSVNTLLVMDVAHVPTGWGQWSAFWLLGSDGAWPNSGEIDIFETVHQSLQNQVTLHTGPGCVVSPANNTAKGNLQDPNCNAGNGNNGCGIIAPTSTTEFGYNVTTAGEAFNKQGGAVFVTEWTDSGIDVWMFARNAVPTTLNTLQPSTVDFPTPLAQFSGSGCDFGKSFHDLQLIINIDACGDWAGNVWQSSGAANATGVSSCHDYVSENPQAFTETYFEFVSLDVYARKAESG